MQGTGLASEASVEHGHLRNRTDGTRRTLYEDEIRSVEGPDAARGGHSMFGIPSVRTGRKGLYGAHRRSERDRGMESGSPGDNKVAVGMIRSIPTKTSFGATASRM